MNPFERLLVDLVEGEVRFMTVGGVACALNGHVRTTEDVDILIDAHPDNVARMLDVLAGFGEGHARELSAADFPIEPGAVRVVEDFPLDIFTTMSGHTYQDLAPEIRHSTHGTVPIPFLSAAGLILLKSPSLQERDRLDVLTLRALIPNDPR